MKIKTVSQLIELSGSYKTTDLVYMRLGDQTVARAKVTPANPRSSDQLKVRSYLTLAMRNWDTLTAAQRSAWQVYAERYIIPGNPDAQLKGIGLNTYARANAIRQALGLAMISDAPLDGPPVYPTGIRQLAAQNPDSLGFELDHGITSVAGYQVLVRATPAMPTVARVPRANEYRYVCGMGPASFHALAASSGAYTFSPTRFIVDPDLRYGVEVRIIRTADGMASTPIYGDFIKQG
jgi:hypothetical protein